MRMSLHAAKKILPRRAVHGAEIGVARGENALTILSEWDTGNCAVLEHLLLVEIDPRQARHIRETLHGYREDAYTLRIGDSVEVAASIPDGSLDFVYLDDDHSEAGVTRSLWAWWPKVREGGVLCGHDFDIDDVQRLVTMFCARKRVALNVDEFDWWTVKWTVEEAQ
jgi:predicted O-methyltransferase YrrM